MPLPALLAIPAGIVTVLTVIQVIFTIIGIIAFIIQAIAGFDFAISFATDIKGPAASLVATMYDTITGILPFTFNDLFSAIDSAIGSTDVFNPALSFSGLMNTIAFKETFNTVMMCMINSLLFVLNVRFLRWSINRLGLRFKS